MTQSSEDEPSEIDYADLSQWPRVRVRGSEARSWLHQLITSDVEGLAPGTSAPALLLSATGRIQADLVVSCDAEGFVLIQTPGQPRPASDLLAPYVLSADVRLEDTTGSTALLAVPEADLPAGLATWSPSALGGGADVLTPADEAASLLRALRDLGLREASPATIEIRRIRRGRPRLGTDFEAGALPAETGLDRSIDVEKGCFLGQESVARVRNAGHPSSVLLRVRADAPIHPGDALQASGEPVGTVTSAAAGTDGAWSAIARLAWGARGASVEIRGRWLEIMGMAG